MTHDAWNPGLSSDIPARLMPLVTLYRPENSSVAYQAAKDAAAFCGLKPSDMVAFTAERLVVHELLIRVTADLSVPDGPNYEELGINLRGMVARIYEVYARPEMAALEADLAALRAQAEAFMGECLGEVFDPPAPETGKVSFLDRLLGHKPETVAATGELDALSALQARLSQERDPMRLASLEALCTVAGGIISVRGRLVPDAEIITRFALTLFANSQSALAVRRHLEPIMARAVAAEGYRFLPAQDKPFFMNVKGASASGKSTIRPQQRALADQLGIPWEDFALISPDYWRKFLLDYESLGADYKYAAMLTGQELEIIDKKLDAYVEEKAATRGLPHLLIDRFRFDSFATDGDGKISSRLLTRFGDTVFLYFLITPPAATVERAWARGLATGRFKAVDDLLYHNIEAYTGMPQLFLSWLGSADKKIHFEFLDNSVPKGALPRTIAYGWNDRMVVLDLEALHNIDRFRAVNVAAGSEGEVLEAAPELTFLTRCVASFKALWVVDGATGKVLRKAENGEWIAPNEAEVLSAEMRKTDAALTLGAW